MIEAEVVVITVRSGQIKARQVSLMKTARVMADVVQEKLSIEPGAVFEGNCRHLQDDLAVAKPETVALPTKRRPLSRPACARRRPSDQAASAWVKTAGSMPPRRPPPRFCR